MAPCLICGAAGHFARAYDEIVSKLPRKPATFTSAAEIKESVSDGIDKQKQPLQPATEDPHARGENKPSENTNPVTPDETNTSSPQPNPNPNNLTKNVSFTVKTGTSGQQTGNLKEQAKAKLNGGAANTKGPASKASQKNGPRQISKDGIRWAKELMRFRRDMDELMKVHVERQTELNPNRNDIMDWDGEYTIQDVMDANGLAEATTPPTGNCQFYAVAEAILQIVRDNMANEKLLEATASRIKQSMNAAARLNFDLEFPEGTHLGILEALGRGDRKMSPKERRADVLDYFSDIASSSSSRSSTLPGSLWGGPESLRMAAKALQRKIFVLIETTYGDRKGFAIYKPQSRVHGGGQFLSAKEHVCTGKQWEDELRQDTNEAVATSSPLPIVMKFANEHYNSLHFRTLNDPTPLANMTSSSLAKHLQGSVRSKAELKTDRSGQFEDDRETDDSMEDSDNSSLGESVWTPSPDEREKFEPNQLSGQHGWSFASQENQLVVYHSPTIELPQQPRKRERDETLMLTAIDGDVAINLNSPNIPLKKTKTLSRRLAVEGDSMQKRRDLERTLQEHWEGFQEQWKQETKCSFPLLSSNRDVWTQAALNEWERILAMLKTSPGPHHVLNHLSGPTLVDLTQVLRGQVIEEGLKRLSYRTDQAETRVWITGWFDRIATATTKQQRVALLNSKEDWLTLEKIKYGGLEVLRLCHPTQLEKLSRYIICTVVYEEELQTFGSSDAEDPDILYEAIEDLCAMLKQTRELKAAFKSGEELSEWLALSVIMAQVTMEVDSVEPSRITTAKEESRLRHYWNRISGVANLDEPTSFWSIHPDATGGVAILTNPKTISETQLIEESKWTNRTVAIKSKGVVWINVYAPNKKSEREHFFRRLNKEFGTRRAAAVLGGDFNCVLDKQRDRDGVEHLRRTGASGGSGVASAEGTDGAFHILEKKLSQSTRPILYRRKPGQRRAMGAIELPKRYSDHQAVVLHMKWTSQPQRPRKANKCRYPIRTSRPDLVRTGVQKAIAHDLELMQSEGSIVWNNLEQRIIKAILRVSRAEKRQVRRYRQKLEDQQHRPANRTRRQLIEEQANTGDVRHFFRRIANWQRDQTISRLEPTPGRFHSPNASLADIMGAEWNQITGQSHAAVPPQKAEQRFDALVYIPGTRKVTEAQNQDLMAPITEKEVREAILIMQAALDKAYHNSAEGLDDAPGIVMLDFMKAYDTLDTDFLYLVLSKFGFGRQFVDLVRRMHSDTTAQYLVNGEVSREWEVKSGIRQGCPLAPLLFIVAAEILALAVQQDPHLEGIRVTRSGAEPHLISTFVDDSAVFLKQGKQLPRLMQLLSEFGKQSGLHVQPTKSSYICLNTAVVHEQRCGIPVLKHGETVRYLGIQIGTGNITQANWEDRLQKLRTRLIIAAKVSNSVVGRVLILNSVLLPSILFTVSYIKPPAKVVDQLVNLQKQFLWKSTLGTDGTRHMVSPSLLYLPVKEGGIGLYSIPLAVKRQAMRRTTRWLQRARDKYTEAWHEQVHQDISQNWGCCAISPKERSQNAQTRLYQTNNIHRLGWEYLCEDLVAAEGRNLAWKDDLKRQMESLLPTLDLEWRSDGRAEETRAFWPSFQWNDNPWIIDSQGEKYTVKTVPFLKECNLASFNARREEERVFSVRLPTMTATLTFKRMTTLRKLVTSIILCSPEIEIDAGNQLNSHQEPWSRKHTKREYKWISNGMGTIIAVPVSEGSHTDYIQMQRQANGVLWTATDWDGDVICQQDDAMIEEEIKTVGWTFKPHPLTTHSLQKLWFIVTSSIPVLLWRTRVEIVHERQHVTIEESTQRVWTACVMQVRAVAHRMRKLKGEKINATCLSQLLSVLERQDLSRQPEAWATARLYFDGGARGNPGPGGSGWALIFLNERSNRWELKACGYAYMGPEVTSNWCEYSALKDGLAYSAHYLQHCEVNLEVFRDSQMIIASQNGFSSIRQTKLQPLAVRVNQIIANFAWTSWNHTKREQNKMADLLANMGMNSKNAKILTAESRGNDQVVMSQVAALLDTDIVTMGRSEETPALEEKLPAPRTANWGEPRQTTNSSQQTQLIESSLHSALDSSDEESFVNVLPDAGSSTLPPPVGHSRDGVPCSTSLTAWRMEDARAEGMERAGRSRTQNGISLGVGDATVSSAICNQSREGSARDVVVRGSSPFRAFLVHTNAIWRTEYDPLFTGHIEDGYSIPLFDSSTIREDSDNVDSLDEFSRMGCLHDRHHFRISMWRASRSRFPFCYPDSPKLPLKARYEDTARYIIPKEIRLLIIQLDVRCLDEATDEKEAEEFDEDEDVLKEEFFNRDATLRMQQQVAASSLEIHRMKRQNLSLAKELRDLKKHSDNIEQQRQQEHAVLVDLVQDLSNKIKSGDTSYRKRKT
ncbi:Rxlr effector protein, partial [Globisporangium splendens]